MQAVKAIKVEYEVLPAIFNPVDALKEDAPRIHEKGNLLVKRNVLQGDVDVVAVRKKRVNS